MLLARQDGTQMPHSNVRTTLETLQERFFSYPTSSEVISANEYSLFTDTEVSTWIEAVSWCS